MKKIWLIVIIIFTFVNIFLLSKNLFLTKIYTDKIDNDIISMDMIDGYYLDEKYDDDTDTFKFYSDDDKTVNIMVLDQLPSNQNLYNNEQMSKSINYQILKDTDNYYEAEFIMEDNISYSKNYNYDNVIEILIRYEGYKILVISHVSTLDLYDEEFIRKINDNIVIK